MHDGMPVTAFGRIDLLTDLVRLIQEIVPKPQSGKTTSRRRSVDDGLSSKQVAQRELLQAMKSTLVARSGQEIERAMLV